MKTSRLRGARTIIASLTAAGIAFMPVSPALAQEPEARARVIVLWLDGTDLGDWSAPNLPNFQAFLKNGAVGLLAARARGGAAGTPLARARAAEAVGGTVCGDRYPESLGAAARRNGSTLARALSAAGRTAEILAGTADDGVTERIARVFGCADQVPAPVPITFAMRADSRFPTGRRVDLAALREATLGALKRSDLVLVDFGDGARVEREFGLDPATRKPWMDLAMRRADVVLGQLRALAGARDSVLVVSPTPSRSRIAAGVHLGAIAMTGPPGVLRSQTTRRDGFASIADLGPTMLAALDIAIPADMTGHAITVRPRTNAHAAVEGLERDLVAAARARRPLTRTALAIAMAFVLVAFLTIASGRGRPAARGRLPRGLRDAVATGLVAVVALPAATSLPIPTSIADARAATAVAVLIPVIASVAFALIARITLGRERALLGSAIASAALPLVDLALPGLLGAGVGFPIAAGARAGGADAGIAGVVIGAGLVSAGFALDRASALRRAKVITSVSFAVAAVMLGSSRFGARPAFGVLAVAAGAMLVARAGRRAPAYLGVAAAAVAAAGLLALERAIALPADASVATVGGVARILAGIIDSVANITVFTIWPIAIAACAAPAVILRQRRGTLIDRGMWGRPYTRAALATAAAAAVVLALAARGGLVGATWIATLSSAGLLLPLLASDD
ncbi:MAG: hypothetical protein WDA27_08180 [Actinomycetota bacterium]